MAEGISLILLLLGALFMLLAAIGMVRMPDVLTRMHSGTKSSTLGVGLIMLGVALAFSDFVIGIRALAIVIFLFTTTPVSARLIARAAYLFGKAPSATKCTAATTRRRTLYLERGTLSKCLSNRRNHLPVDQLSRISGCFVKIISWSLV